LPEGIYEGLGPILIGYKFSYFKEEKGRKNWIIGLEGHQTLIPDYKDIDKAMLVCPNKSK